LKSLNFESIAGKTPGKVTQYIFEGQHRVMPKFQASRQSSHDQPVTIVNELSVFSDPECSTNSRKEFEAVRRRNPHGRWNAPKRQNQRLSLW
jgi:hypothetical protein